MDQTNCCPQFNPEPWDGKEITWTDKLFIKDRVKSLFHIPLNFGQVMTRNMNKIKATGDDGEEIICLSDENSLWGADVYLSVKAEIPDANNTRLSGTYLTKVFEGSYRNMKNWIMEMNNYVVGKNKVAKKLYFYYTTCPKCAKIYGKNYVVILAEI